MSLSNISSASEICLEEVSDTSLCVEETKEHQDSHLQDLEAVSEASSTSSQLSEDWVAPSEERDLRAKLLRKELLDKIRSKPREQRVVRKIVWGVEDEGRIRQGTEVPVKDNITVIIRNPGEYDYSDTQPFFQAVWRTTEGRQSSIQAAHQRCLKHRLSQKNFVKRFCCAANAI